MSPSAPQPHDHLFRLVFSDTQEAAAFFRARLPDSLRGRFDWSTLRQIPGSFVDQDRRGSVTDLLFEAQLSAAAKGKPPWLYLLFEHQSRPDRWMAWRLLRYCCRIWEEGRRKYPDEEFLRPVLPLVFYQGKGGWRYSLELTELFPPELRDQPWLPRFRPVLFDQTQVAPEAVVGARGGRLLQLAMMHAFDQAAAEARERFTPLLAELKRESSSGGVDYFNVFFGYIQETGPAGTQQALDEVMRRRAPELRGVLMTNGEMLRQEGRLQGLQRGRQEGRREGQLDTIEGFLRAGVEWPVIESATGIDERTYRGLKDDSAHDRRSQRPAGS